MKFMPGSRFWPNVFSQNGLMVAENLPTWPVTIGPKIVALVASRWTAASIDWNQARPIPSRFSTSGRSANVFSMKTRWTE